MGESEKRKKILNTLDYYFEGIFNNEVENIPLSKNVTLAGPFVPGVLEGRDAVHEFLIDVAASFSNAQYHAEKDIIDGKDVFSLIKVRLSGGQVLDMGHLFVIKNGKIHSIQTLFDPRVMLE
ncbi:nuclear transport factor 2 family protein [Fulvivirga sedimenti]|uniref:Nuclear transport factor 2 family protein n=1 Tax=Fulvivirga sedimenti TaxID=2879465 RepID=A0A9X1L138_9BACT|nr:nuclear transport factor 2 family protein [Fulvivirga sedimenti]MCA6078529.1 nuclear transport factor 2 family protein [Fulvivirga sedimenti]